MMYNALNDFYDQLCAANSESDAGAALIDFVQEHGADGCNIWFAAGIYEMKTINSSASTYPKSLLHYMYELALLDQMELVQRVANSISPIRWGWKMARRAYEQASPDYVYQHTFHGEIGYQNVLLIPISVPGKIGSSGVGLFTNQHDEWFESLLEEKGALLQLAAYAGHLRMQTLRQKNSDRPILSKHQIECLLWAAQGLTLKEIATKIGKSEHTVDWHMRKARKTLSVHTTRQAVAKAIVLKLISP